MEKEKSLEEIIGGNFLMATLVYIIQSQTWPKDSDAGFLKRIEEWKEEATKILIKSLDESGFAIVKKEPALDKFPSLT